MNRSEFLKLIPGAAALGLLASCERQEAPVAQRDIVLGGKGPLKFSKAYKHGEVDVVESYWPVTHTYSTSCDDGTCGGGLRGGPCPLAGMMDRQSQVLTILHERVPRGFEFWVERV